MHPNMAQPVDGELRGDVIAASDWPSGQ